MEIIPAIDLRDGKCVRLTQGNYDKQNIYSDDPVTVAKRWKDSGATRLHVVDLDGAKAGAPQNESVIARIVNEGGLPVQLGGGIRSLEIASRLLGLGVDRVIFGSAALANPAIGEIFSSLGERAVLGIDAKDGMVAVHGWLDTSRITALELALDMQSKGARRIIFTDIAKDGMLAGPNIAATLALKNALNIPVIASGGVSNIDDIAALIKIDVEGVIVGKSLYEEKLSLVDAIALAAKS